MGTLPFLQIDVFTSRAFLGNPVAVVFDADALTGAQMAAVARWTNLSETTFVLLPAEPAADYRLRIFTPGLELPFAGHPTIGSCLAWRHRGGRPKAVGAIRQQCGAGLVEIRESDGPAGPRLLRLPEGKQTPLTAAERGTVATALGVGAADLLQAARIDVGPVWNTVQVASAEAVLALRPDLTRLAALREKRLDKVTVFGALPAGEEAAYEVRSFAPAVGVPEDPVCGSGNGCVALLLRESGQRAAGRYVARQGRAIGRDGYVQIEIAPDGTVWLGGDAVVCVEGQIRL